MPNFVDVSDDVPFFNGFLKFEGSPGTCEGPFLSGLGTLFASFVVCRLLFYLLLRACFAEWKQEFGVVSVW